MPAALAVGVVSSVCRRPSSPPRWLRPPAARIASRRCGRGNRVGPLGDQYGAAVEDGGRLVRRAPLGRELVRRQVAEDRGVARHRLGGPAGGEPAGHPVRAVRSPDPPYAQVKLGHRVHGDPVPRLQVRAQALAWPAGHRRAEADQVAVRVDVRSLAQLVRPVADAAGQPANAGPRPLVVQRVGVPDIQVGGADVLVVGLGPVPFVERQVQAHLVPLSEPVPVPVPVPVGVRFHLEAERRVVRQRAPQVAHGEDRTEAAEPAARRDSIVHEESISHATGDPRAPSVRVGVRQSLGD